MIPIVILGLLLLSAGYVYLRKKRSDDGGNGTISDQVPEHPLDTYRRALLEYEQGIPTDIYFYPGDDIPDILQEPQPITWFHPHYGCPPGYSVDNMYNVAGGPEIQGMPGVPNQSLICRQTQAFARADVLRYPVSIYEVGGPAGNSSAFHQWYTRHTVLSNYMAGLNNTMNWRSLDMPYQGIDISQMQYGGTGAAPTPYQLPETF